MELFGMVLEGVVYFCIALLAIGAVGGALIYLGLI